jgi:HD superfamily phosphohydrolase
MELAGRALDAALVNTDSSVLRRAKLDTNRDQARRLVRLGALLHDIGHAPFSHGPEHLLPLGSDGAPTSHEEISAALIEERLAPLLRSDAFDQADAGAVAAIAVGAEFRPSDDLRVRLLSDLVTGTLGVDRMDYLLRDSWYTGVQYGHYDLQRLIGTLKIVDVGGELSWALEEGGSYVAEQMLMARWFMSLQVYYHRTRRILDHHLSEFLAQFLPTGRFPSALDDYLNWTDVEVLAAIRSSDHASARAIESRSHLRWVQEFSSEDFASPDDFRGFAAELKATCPSVVPDDYVVRIRKAGDAEIWIETSTGAPVPLQERSEVVKLLRPRWIGRLYAPSDDRQLVRDAVASALTARGEPR